MCELQNKPGFCHGEKKYLGLVSLLLFTDSRSAIVTRVCRDGARNWDLLLACAGAISKLASGVGTELLVSYSSGRGSRTSETCKTECEKRISFLIKCNVHYSILHFTLWKTVGFIYKVCIIQLCNIIKLWHLYSCLFDIPCFQITGNYHSAEIVQSQGCKTKHHLLNPRFHNHPWFQPSEAVEKC